jgi:hypothetical protein
LLGQALRATELSRWILALAIIISAGLVSLTVAAHVRGDAAPIGHVHSAQIIKVIVPPSPESGRERAGPSSTYPSSPVLTGLRFRFGFLEFEDDPDASTE